MMLIVIEFSSQSKLKINLLFLRRISLGMYFCHGYIILLWQYWSDKIYIQAESSMWKVMIFYIIIVFCFTKIMIFILDKWKNRRKRSERL